ncbi:MAG: carboxylating nicotinate-nucleotide diphosphorylase [Calditrichaeota bacterium]|nr:carboxylating nicotinate-nucleotide diphosphorylase [Calditrichota bacterium]MCB9366384.1 carboxylating nicotinate-nucleotide diphosphorylase [Calditrichota bacterium]MCB9391986.1 carboxylating nicotinate-nucleotide diphosphorylase [Calditrichota bacterium]
MIIETMDIVRLALEEDLTGDMIDVTTDSLVDPELSGEAWIEAREDAIIAGLSVAKEVFRAVDPEVVFTPLCADGDHVRPLNRVASINGKAVSILKAERTALNFLTHLSGVATKTAELVQLTGPYQTKVWATRKTTPGLRKLELDAVRAGGGDTYRENLFERVLVKDNHIGIIGGIEALTRRLDINGEADPKFLDGKVEVASLHELELAVGMGWKQILLDNFAPEQVREAVERHGHEVALEASGGIHTGNIREYAATGVPAISIGQLTHSVRSVDFALEVDWSIT